MPNLDNIWDLILKTKTAARTINKVRITFLVPEGMMARWTGEILIHPDDWDRIVAGVNASPEWNSKFQYPFGTRVFGIPVIKDPAVVVRDTARAWVNEACERWYLENAV